MRTMQRSATVHASVFDHFDQERTLHNRQNFKLNHVAAIAVWRDLFAA